MKKTLLGALAILMFLPHTAIADEPAFTSVIVDLKDGSEMTTEAFADELHGVEVLVLGEEHDSDGAHRMQLAIIEELVKSGRNIAISTEMFERDCQGVLNEYLADRIDEEAFLASSRPWRNYAQHYRPIIELAKSHRLPVLASNTPREIASMVSKGESIPSPLSPFHARSTSAGKDLYWENFVNAMKGHGGMDGSDAARLFFESQCLKDDTMAESITDFLACHSHRPVLVVHLCGKFHSDYGLGTVSRILTRNGLARVVVVSTDRVDSKDEFDLKDAKGRAHYTMLVPQNVVNASESAKPEDNESSED
ncbi:ChaN family lipoprotein [Pirellulaceae bacterium SH449]